jgi:acyl-coenzyme A thioesterase PaaI-like protein
MPESLSTKLIRWGFNFFPAYRGTGARITYIAADWREVRIKLPLNWRTRNYVGTIFGGSMYAAVDPIYMIMLIKVLGPEYVVWDKAAAIRFQRPGKRTLHAKFVLTGEEVDAIRAAAGTSPSIERNYLVELVDSEGTLHASVDKTIYIRRKNGVAENNEGSRI